MTHSLHTNPGTPLSPTPASEGITIRKTLTTPRPPKKPRDVWEVDAPAKWHGMLYALGAKKWRGRLRFWEDPTDAITKALANYEPESYGERVEGKNQRSVARAGRYETLSEKREQQAEQSWKKSDDAVRFIPPGQPILLGHHSQRRHERDLEKSHNAAFKALALEKEAKDYVQKADGAVARVERQDDVGFMHRRLTEAQTNLRKITASLEGTGTDLEAYANKHGLAVENVQAWHVRAIARKEEYEQAIDYWQKQIDGAGGLRFGKGDLEKGDLISGKGCHGWAVVQKCNPKTVSVLFLSPALRYAGGDPMGSKVDYANIKNVVKREDMSQEQKEQVEAILSIKSYREWQEKGSPQVNGVDLR